jgi:hypothetical protein
LQGEYKALRKLMVNAILSTDMSVHKDLLAKVVLRATRETVRGSGAGGFSRASNDDRSLLVAFLLHTADLCNPCLPPAMSYRIANELGKEFARQAEMEHAAGLPITVMLSDTAVGKAKLELGFIGAPPGINAGHVWLNASSVPLLLHVRVRSVRMHTTHLTPPCASGTRFCGCAALCNAGHHRARLRAALPASHQRQPRHVDAHHLTATAARAPLRRRHGARRADGRHSHRRVYPAGEEDRRDGEGGCVGRGSQGRGHRLR